MTRIQLRGKEITCVYKDKLDTKTIKCIFLGYSSFKTEYKCYLLRILGWALNPEADELFNNENIAWHEFYLDVNLAPIQLRLIAYLDDIETLKSVPLMLG